MKKTDQKSRNIPICWQAGPAFLPELRNGAVIAIASCDRAGRRSECFALQCLL